MKTVTAVRLDPVITAAEHHRNGITGKGFWVCQIAADRNPDTGYPALIAIKFDGAKKGEIAVLDPKSLAAGQLDSKWRGGDFEEAVTVFIGKKERGG